MAGNQNSGRKPLSEDARPTRLALTIDPQVAAALAKIAKSEYLSLREFLRKTLRCIAETRSAS
jgi:hypothetical protein